MRLTRIPYLLLLMPALLFADEVYLKGGGSFSGRITEQTPTSITMDIGNGVVGVPTSRVERIVKGKSPLDEYDERASRLAPDDLDGWRSLGRWASHQGLSAQSRQAYEKVVAIAPDDAEARQGLGYVLVDGRWLTEEEGYRARGYVQFDGEWMTRAEAQAAQAADAANLARQDAERSANLAKADQIQAEARAAEEADRARWQEETDSWNDPVYWGGWGYGMTYWPSNVDTKWRPANRPPQTPTVVPK